MTEAMTAAHVEKLTLSVDVNLPEHAARGGATALFATSRTAAIEAAGARCFICRQTAEETGHPLEAHHFPVERCFAESDLVDWQLFIINARAGVYGPGPQSFEWSKFDPTEPMIFVDDMLHNGLILCKAHHIGKDEGIHMLPHPIWLAQGFVKEGVQFNQVEKIHRDNLTGALNRA